MRLPTRSGLWTLVSALVIAVACTGTETTLAPAVVIPSASAAQAQVARIIDGDTIDVFIEGQTYRVRYTGIDTPETVHPTRGVEPYGKEASERNRQLVEGKTVMLKKDISETDRFGRLLRYVYVDDVMVNAQLVAEGYARVSTFPPDVKYAEDFVALERDARENRVGLWADSLAAPATAGAQGSCDPSYPDTCIPSPPPDLDCGEIIHRRFSVLPPDPHRFDGDKDGVGCER